MIFRLRRKKSEETREMDLILCADVLSYGEKLIISCND